MSINWCCHHDKVTDRQGFETVYLIYTSNIISSWLVQHSAKYKALWISILGKTYFFGRFVCNMKIFYNEEYMYTVKEVNI